MIKWYFRPTYKIFVLVTLFSLSYADLISPFDVPSLLKRGWLPSHDNLCGFQVLLRQKKIKNQFENHSKPLAMYERSPKEIPNSFDARLALVSKPEKFFNT